MTETCPVCGDGVEHRRTERGKAGAAESEGAGASFDLDDLCAVDAGTRWDRICTAATADAETDGDGAPVLTIYYHFFGEGD